MEPLGDCSFVLFGFCQEVQSICTLKKPIKTHKRHEANQSESMGEFGQSVPMEFHPFERTDEQADLIKELATSLNVLPDQQFNYSCVFAKHSYRLLV